MNVDWEMRARELADTLKVIAIVLGVIAIVKAIDAEGSVAIAWWIAFWFALACYLSADEKIEP